MKIHSNIFYAVSFAIGMILIVAGFFLFVHLAGDGGAPDTRANVILTMGGALFLYLTMICTKRPSHLFVGLFLIAAGMFSLLVARRIIPYSMNEWWPILVIFAGASFFAAGMFSRRKIRLSVVFPAATLVVLGALFMLFSFHLAPISFRSAVSVFGPFCLMAMGVFIVAFFLLQRKYNSLRISEEDDEDSLNETD